MLADDDRTLVATAAKGLEEEVERGVRIPVGKGSRGASPPRAGPSQIRGPRGPPTSSTRSCARRAWRSLLGVPLLVGGGRDRRPARRHPPTPGASTRTTSTCCSECRGPGQRWRSSARVDRTRARPCRRAPEQSPARDFRTCRAVAACRPLPACGIGFSGGATGTTPSRCRTAGSAWRSATWSAAASTPRRSWDSCAAVCARTRWTGCHRAPCWSA